MEYIAKAIVSITMIGAGMYGLHTGIEYSGWVLLGGALVALDI